jgi:putative SOS response-associated peptidase YedK
VTTEPNEVIGRVHNRMPAILSPEAYGLWLDPTFQDVEGVQAVLRPFPAEEMVAFPVGTQVNSPVHDSPDLIVPLAG